MMIQQSPVEASMPEFSPPTVMRIGLSTSSSRANREG
jgi:hypothetical protein